MSWIIDIKKEFCEENKIKLSLSDYPIFDAEEGSTLKDL